MIYTTMLWEKTREVFNSETKVLTREDYFVRKDEWRAFLKIDLNDWSFLRIKKDGGTSELWKVRESPYLGHQLIEGPALNAFKEECIKLKPVTKYWFNKMVSPFDYYETLAKLVHFENIKETESLLITYTFHYFNEEEGEGHIGTSFWSIAAPGWGKKGLDRKKIINYLRESKDSFYSIPYLLERMKRDEEKEKDPDSEYYIGEGDCKLNKSDIAFLRRNEHFTSNPEFRSIVGEFSDWLYFIRGKVTDVRDPYFRHKKNWRKLHQRYVKKEEREHYLGMISSGIRGLLGLPNREDEKKEKKEIKQFTKRYEQYKDMIYEVNDLKVYISSSFSDWQIRAASLRQCIVSCKYYTHKNCILVFIDRNGSPAYTAEILAGNKVGQFMGDERNLRDAMIIPGDARQALSTFLGMYNII